MRNTAVGFIYETLLLSSRSNFEDWKSSVAIATAWLWLCRLKEDKKTFCCQFTVGVDLRQFVSSDLSLQSASPSHFQFMWTHSPLPHWNSPTGQRGFLGSVLRLQRSMDSSDLSLQSGSPSQLHSVGMHSESLQRNSCWPQVGAEHLCSSLPSPQSSSPSQTKIGATHFPLRHWKSLEGHALPSVGGWRQGNHVEHEPQTV